MLSEYEGLTLEQGLKHTPPHTWLFYLSHFSDFF